MKIEGCTFIVSGGSSGLGLATVRELLNSNAYVAIIDKSPPPSTLAYNAHPRSTSTKGKETRRVLYINTDITQTDETTSAVERVIEWTKETGSILRGVVNCAGIGYPELMVNSRGDPHTKSTWDKMLAVNLTGTFDLTRLVVSKMVRHSPPENSDDTADGDGDGERGIVIMVSSTVAYEGVRGQTAYAATKGAILSMTLPLSRDLARHNIRVVTIAPGPFSTPLTTSSNTGGRTPLPTPTNHSTSASPNHLTSASTSQSTPSSSSPPPPTNYFFRTVEENVKNGKAVAYPRRFGKAEEFGKTVRWVVETSIVNGETIKLTGGLRVSANL